MREDICTIPINDVFGPKDGCPVCRMRDMLEERIAGYITGAAMMEPDVRIETNRLGFCERHFGMIRDTGSRLPVALILQSHLKEIEETIFPRPGAAPGKKELEAARALGKSCFMCENIEKNMDHLFETVLKMWQSEEEFRALYAAQPYLCLPHYARMAEAAQRMPRKNRAAFLAVTAELGGNALRELEHDVTHFCAMFDYRNGQEDWGNSRDSIERSMHFLTSRPVGDLPKTGSGRAPTQA